MRVLENGVLRKIFWPKKEITETALKRNWYLYSSPNATQWSNQENDMGSLYGTRERERENEIGNVKYNTHSSNYRCRGKSVSITYSECIPVAIFFHHACAALYCHLWPFWLYPTLPHYLVNGTIFGEKKFKNKMFWFSLQLLSDIILILRSTEPDSIINIHTSSCIGPIILVGFELNLDLLCRRSKKLRYQISSKSVQWKPSCSTRTFRQTDGWTGAQT